MTETRLDLVHDFGGRGPALHLAHGNGFPPGTYRLLAETLTGQFHVLALPARPLWPGSRPETAADWRPLAGDLVQGLEALGLRDVIATGHSLGSVLSLWAAIDRPDLVRALVLIEPVLLPPTWLRALGLMRRLGLGPRQPLVQDALRRQREWPSRQACFAHYRRKKVFGRWSDEALWDYVNADTVAAPEDAPEDGGLSKASKSLGQEDGKVTLRYPPEWEAHIFATTPLDVWHDVPRLRVPCLVIRGGLSNTFRPSAQAHLARLLPRAQFVTIAGAGHLVPIERPAETGAAILAFLAGLPPTARP